MRICLTYAKMKNGVSRLTSQRINNQSISLYFRQDAHRNEQ